MTLQNIHGIPRVGFGLCKISLQASGSKLQLPEVSKIIHPECRCEILQLDFVLSEAGKQVSSESNQNRRFNNSRASCDAAFNSFQPVYN